MTKRTKATDGRVIGTRAAQTRLRILDATKKLLDNRGVLEIKVVDITREVRMSPATFYQYFPGVNEAILALADEAATDARSVVHLLELEWTPANALEHAHDFTKAYVDYWQDHQSVLRARNLLAEEGDVKFREARTRDQLEYIRPLIQRIESGQKAGRIAAELHPYAAAAAMMAMLDRLVAYLTELGRRGVSRTDMENTIARILVQTVTGHG